MEVRWVMVVGPSAKLDLEFPLGVPRLAVGARFHAAGLGQFGVVSGIRPRVQRLVHAGYPSLGLELPLSVL